MGLAQINDDLMHLAGRLSHRSAQSEQERKAGLYIEARLGQYTSNVSVETFHAPENYSLLFASYLAEFLFVGVIALAWPSAAFGYGLGVFLLYLYEFCGYRGLSRFLPQYPSQNIVGRFLGTRPRGLVLISAHYDSGSATPFSTPAVIPWLRPLHLALMAAMAIVIATCAADAFSTHDALAISVASIIRWGAIVLLLGGALGLYWNASRGEDIRGANHNASGVAALLGLAEKLQAQPFEHVDVWIAATGSNESWMAGMRHLLADRSVNPAQSWVINIEGVGAGGLHYLEEEGFVHALHPAPALVQFARELQAGRPVRPGKLRAVPTAAHVPLMRGMKALTLMGLDSQGLPPRWNQLDDRLAEVDETGVAEAIEFTYLLLGRIDQSLDESAT